MRLALSQVERQSPELHVREKVSLRSMASEILSVKAIHPSLVECRVEVDVPFCRSCVADASTVPLC